jgi:hypothetical protein
MISPFVPALVGAETRPEFFPSPERKLDRAGGEKNDFSEPDKGAVIPKLWYRAVTEKLHRAA